MTIMTPNTLRNPDWRIGLHVLAMLALLATGCRQESQPAVREQLPVTQVTVVQATNIVQSSFEEIPGTVVPRVKSVLEAKVVGRIGSLGIESGQMVKAGDTLLKINAPEVQARVDQAEAGLRLAQQEHQRAQNLFARQAATRAEVEAVTARLDQARAAAAEAGVMLGYLSVAAPFDGVVSRKLVEVGDLAAPGKPLIEIEQPGGKQFEVALSEALIAKVKLGDTLLVNFDDGDEPVAATVAEIDPSGDPGSRSWRVKLDLPVGSSFRSGAFGRVAVPGEGGQVIVVPATALVQRGQLEQVFVVADDKALLRLVKTGRVAAGKVVILSGLEADAWVVVNPAADLRDGQPVTTR